MDLNPLLPTDWSDRTAGRATRLDNTFGIGGIGYQSAIDELAVSVVSHRVKSLDDYRHGAGVALRAIRSAVAKEVRGLHDMTPERFFDEFLTIPVDDETRNAIKRLMAGQVDVILPSGHKSRTGEVVGVRVQLKERGLVDVATHRNPWLFVADSSPTIDTLASLPGSLVVVINTDEAGTRQLDDYSKRLDSDVVSTNKPRHDLSDIRGQHERRVDLVTHGYGRIDVFGSDIGSADAPLRGLKLGVGRHKVAAVEAAQRRFDVAREFGIVDAAQISPLSKVFGPDSQVSAVIAPRALTKGPPQVSSRVVS